jgi:hypothetical protein
LGMSYSFLQRYCCCCFEDNDLDIIKFWPRHATFVLIAGHRQQPCSSVSRHGSAALPGVPSRCGAAVPAWFAVTCNHSCLW